MKKLLVYLLLSTVLSAVFFSCKKYEDGPLISFIPKDKRLSGAWSFEKVNSSIDGDITIQFTGDVLDINEDNTGVYKQPSIPDDTFTWVWDDKKEYVTFTYASGLIVKAKVLKLKEEELWFEVDDAGEVTEYHLAQ